MEEDSPEALREVLDAQRLHWENTLSTKPEMFGVEASSPARYAAEFFKKENRKKILELGAGQGRDTLFFAQNGCEIYALDYSKSGLIDIMCKTHALGLSKFVRVIRHDARKPLPFIDDAFDACYSHMLYCMALTTSELEFLSDEVRRVLKTGGLNIYTVRHTNDPDYRTGIHRGEDMYEAGRFTVHYFSRQKVEHLARGYEIVSVDEFEEGRLPRKLFRVTLRKHGKGS